MKSSRQIHMPSGTAIGQISASDSDAYESPSRKTRVMSGPHSPLATLAVIVTPLLALLWAGLVFLIDDIHFVLLTPDALTSVDAASSLSRFFGALVLLLFPSDRLGPRLRWIAAGFIILGLGGLLFRVVWPLMGHELTPDHGAYASIVVWSAAGIMFVVALFPRAIPVIARRVSVILPAVFLILVLVLGALDALPQLVAGPDSEFGGMRRDALLRGLSIWHWVFSSVPLVLSLIAAACAVYFYVRSELGAWLAIAMMLLAGSQVHNLFWPAAYSSVLTTSDVLRFLFGAVVVTGGVVSLRRVAIEREQLLALEKDYSSRLSELATLKDNFTAMVAHELHSPLAAVRSLATVVSYPDIDPVQRAKMTDAIQHEIDLLTTLVGDVQDIAAIERSTFEVNVQPVPVERILSDIEVYGAVFSRAHEIRVNGPSHTTVLADQERIGQVLRNLLNNAVKYSPEGTVVDIVAQMDGDRVWFHVSDEGYGIAPEDRQLIFECYGRGSDPRTLSIRGSGLGLYLSRRIVVAHGSDIEVESVPGEGSTFSFSLKVAS